MSRLAAPFALLAAIACGQSPTLAHQNTQPIGKTGERGEGVPAFWVRPGYKVTVAAEVKSQARFLAFDDKGNLYVSQPDRGSIRTFKPKGSGYEELAVYVDGYRQVQYMQWVDGWLWFATSKGIYKSRDTNGDGKADDINPILEDLTGGSGHWWRSLLVTKDSIYTSVGDTGNITDLREGEREKVWRYDLDGKNKRLFISGIRNTEELLVRPGTSDIYGVDHGSDWFGGPIGEREGKQPITDFNPPDEFNKYEEGKFYGHPFLTGYRVPRIEYQNKSDILEIAAKTTPPVWAFGAHWAANAFCFVSQKSHFPADHYADAFVACHGSWNDSQKVGYRVERILFDPYGGVPYGSLMIVGCLGNNGEPLSRPVDCVEAPDGSILFSSDTENKVYRISYVGAK